MGQLSMAQRVEKFEESVEALKRLPAVVADLAVRTGNLESQFSQLRSEMKVEFSAVRRDFADLRGEVGELRLGFDATRFEVGALSRKVDQLGTDMRVLHEEVIDRLKVLHESRPAPKPRRPRKR